MRDIGLSAVGTAVSGSAARVQKLTQAMWRVLTLSAADERIAPRRDLCIAIEKSGLSVAYGKRFLSRISMKGVRSFRPEEPGYPQPRDVASSTALAVREFGAAGGGITLSIPKAWAIVKTAELPVTVRENLPDVVAYELDRLMPFNAEAAYYDFAVLKETAEKITIAVTAVKADILNSYLETLGAEGIGVSRITTNLSGLGALCSFAQGGKDMLLAEVREDGYDAALYLDGALAGVVSDTFASGDGKWPVDELASDMGALVESARKLGRAPRLIALKAGPMAAMKDALQAKMQMPVMPLDGAALKLGPLDRQKDIPYAALGGAIESLSPKAKKMDLLTKGRKTKAKTPAALTALFLVTILALGLTYLFAPLKFEEAKLRDIERQIKLKKKGMKDIETLRKGLDAVSGEVSTIYGFKKKAPMSVALLKELTDILPKSTWLTRVKITGSNVELEGYASSATELLPRLESSKFFRKVEFASATFRDAKMGSDRFSMKMEIRGAPESKGAAVQNAKK